MNLKEIYLELYALMKEEKIQDDLKKDLMNFRELKEILIKTEGLISKEMQEIQEINQKYIQNIDKLLIEKTKSIYLISDKSFNLLNNLHMHYIHAIKQENEGDFIKHDIVMEMTAKEGNESHLEKMLNYISENLPIHIARVEKNENGISKSLVTMTSFDLLSLNKFLVKMSRGLVDFEARTIMPDLIKRTIQEHNDLLNLDNKLGITNGKYIGYFINQYKIPIGAGFIKNYLTEDFFDGYHTFRNIHNRNHIALESSQVIYRSEIPMDVEGRINNPFTEFELQENQSLQNNDTKRNKRPKM